MPTGGPRACATGSPEQRGEARQAEKTSIAAATLSGPRGEDHRPDGLATALLQMLACRMAQGEGPNATGGDGREARWEPLRRLSA